MKIGCVVMAAGNSCRFGGNKLLADWRGRPLVSYALDAVPAGVEAVVVSQYPAVLSMALERGFLAVTNDRPDEGISRTIRLGLTALPACDGVLFLVADQPRLRRETVEAVVRLWRETPEQIVQVAANGRRGNPCLFPAWCFPELLELEGDVGGNRVICRHPDHVASLKVDPLELSDIDTPSDLPS